MVQAPKALCMTPGPHRMKQVEMDSWEVVKYHNTKTGKDRYAVRGESSKCKHALTAFIKEGDAQAYANHPKAKSKNIKTVNVTPKPRKAKRSKKGGALEGGAKKKCSKKSSSKKSSKKRSKKRSTKKGGFSFF